MSEASATSLDVLRPAVEAALLAGLRIEIEAELGGDHHLSAERRQRFAHELLVGEWAVDFGGVEEGDAALDGRADQRDSCLLFDRRTVAKAQPHAAEADGRDFQLLFPSLRFCMSFSSQNCTVSVGQAPVLLVADLFHPVDDLAVELLLNGDMRHRRRRRGAVPMLLAGREPDHVAGPDFLDRAAPALHPDRSRK